jgi:hypothetical protein
MKQWTLHDIEQAATAAADRGQPFPPGFVKDGELREALRASMVPVPAGGAASLPRWPRDPAAQPFQHRDRGRTARHAAPGLTGGITALSALLTRLEG